MAGSDDKDDNDDTEAPANKLSLKLKVQTLSQAFLWDR